MADEIKEDIGDTTFLERNLLEFNKKENIKLYEQKIKKLSDYNLDEYLKYRIGRSHSTPQKNFFQNF